MILGALTIVVLIAYIMYKNAKVDYNKILKKGDTGKEVIVFQETLNTLDRDGNKVYKSGYFGGSTEDKLFKFLAVKETSITGLKRLYTQKNLKEKGQAVKQTSINERTVEIN